MVEESEIWEEVKKTVSPLKGGKRKTGLPPRLHVYRAQSSDIISTLDLHGFTVQEAYDIFRKFVKTHFKNESKNIWVITGKGMTGQGLIKREIDGWIGAKDINNLVRSAKWINGGGVVEIALKKKVKK